jgi:Protein of unknown function, DUF488
MLATGAPVLNLRDLVHGGFKVVGPGNSYTANKMSHAHLDKEKHPPPQEADWPKETIFTVGHSTLPLEEFIGMLKAYGIACLADIRTMPRSRHNLRFNGDMLGIALRTVKIHYVALSALGGLRHARKDSPNSSSLTVSAATSESREGWRHLEHSNRLRWPAGCERRTILVGRRDSNHNPRNCVSKSFLIPDIGPRDWFTVGPYEVNNDSTVTRPQNTFRHLHYRSVPRSSSKFRILKNHRAETRRGIRGLQRETSEIPRQRPDFWPLTSGNVAISVLIEIPSERPLWLAEHTVHVGPVSPCNLPVCRVISPKCRETGSLNAGQVSSASKFFVRPP